MDSNTSLRIVQESMEQLQHREAVPLPPLPPELVRGNPESILSSVAVQPTVVLGPTEKELLKPVFEKLGTSLREQAGLPATFSADEAVNHDGLHAALAEWARQQKGPH